MKWKDHKALDLSPRERAMCDYAVKLTEASGRITADDLQPLREVGLSDRDIHDAVQVISYFNYINRVADAAHVDLEPEMAPYPKG